MPFKYFFYENALTSISQLLSISIIPNLLVMPQSSLGCWRWRKHQATSAILKVILKLQKGSDLAVKSTNANYFFLLFSLNEREFKQTIGCWRRNQSKSMLSQLVCLRGKQIIRLIQVWGGENTHKLQCNSSSRRRKVYYHNFIFN